MESPATTGGDKRRPPWCRGAVTSLGFLRPSCHGTWLRSAAQGKGIQGLGYTEQEIPRETERLPQVRSGSPRPLFGTKVY